MIIFGFMLLGISELCLMKAKRSLHLIFFVASVILSAALLCVEMTTLCAITKLSYSHQISGQDFVLQEMFLLCLFDAGVVLPAIAESYDTVAYSVFY